MPVRMVALFFCMAVAASGQVQDDAVPGFGSLILQSPVQAVASINDEGSFLIIPGQDLCWKRIPPGTYRILARSGPQQWRQNVQVRAGETVTLVAVLDSPGPPLSATALPPVPPPAVPSIPAARQASLPPAAVPPPAPAMPAAPAVPAPATIGESSPSAAVTPAKAPAPSPTVYTPAAARQPRRELPRKPEKEPSRRSTRPRVL